MPGDNYCAEHEPIYGRYVPRAEKLYILPGALSRMLTDNGFSPEKSVKGFKERGYISGKQEQQRVGKGSVKVIIANIRLDYTQYDSPLFSILSIFIRILRSYCACASGRCHKGSFSTLSRSSVGLNPLE